MVIIRTRRYVFVYALLLNDDCCCKQVTVQNVGRRRRLSVVDDAFPISYSVHQQTCKMIESHEEEVDLNDALTAD